MVFINYSISDFSGSTDWRHQAVREWQGALQPWIEEFINKKQVCVANRPSLRSENGVALK
jgi:hypothetical protein